MSDEDVTHVTRNGKDHAELKLAIDLLTSAALLYYATHPDCLDGIGDVIRDKWQTFRAKVSYLNAVMRTKQGIDTLPETDE